MMMRRWLRTHRGGTRTPSAPEAAPTRRQRGNAVAGHGVHSVGVVLHLILCRVRWIIDAEDSEAAMRCPSVST